MPDEKPIHAPLLLSAYQPAENDFPNLSLRDLMAGRDLYHMHLMRRILAWSLPSPSTGTRRPDA